MFIKKEQVSSHPASNAKVEQKRERGEGEGERKKSQYKGGKSSGKEGGEGKWRMHL